MAELKLIFDECLSEPIVESLRPFLEKAGTQLVCRGVVQFQKQGVPDKDWVPKIAAEGGWIVISSDNGRRNRNERADEKLPYLCRHYRVTHVLLSPNVHRLRQFEKGQAIVAVWQELVVAAAALNGTRFKIKKRDRSAGFFLFNDDKREPVKISSGGTGS